MIPDTAQTRTIGAQKFRSPGVHNAYKVRTPKHTNAPAAANKTLIGS